MIDYNQVSQAVCNSIMAATGGVAAVFQCIPDRDCWQLVVCVPDMVRPLQVQRVDIEGNRVRPSNRAIAEDAAPIIRLVHEERDLRHWSACDP